MVKNYVQNNAIYGVGESVVGQVRKANEDNCGHASTENGELFVVCDGMGGHVGGATASDIGVRSIIEFISRNKMEDKRVLLAEALKFANMQIFGRASEDATLKGMGTTACIALIDGDNIWLAHVGDSRIYLYSAADKFLYRVTKDHSFVQGLVDSGQLDDRDAENHPQKNIIMRALGIKEDVKPEVAPEPMHCAKGDIIMICSDGLSGMIDDVHIEKKIRENKADLADLCQQLIDDANTPDKGKDNITCQLIRIEASAAAAAKHPDYTPNWRNPRLPKSPKPKDPNDSKEDKKSESSKLWLWISLATVLILLGAGVIFAILYVNNNRHMFKRDYQVEYTQESNKGTGFNMKSQLRDGAEPLKWEVNQKGVRICENILYVDSSYMGTPDSVKTWIKVEARYKGKEYTDSIYMKLWYKVQETDEEIKDRKEENVQEEEQQQSDLSQTPENDEDKKAKAEEDKKAKEMADKKAKAEAEKKAKEEADKKAKEEAEKKAKKSSYMIYATNNSYDTIGSGKELSRGVISYTVEKTHKYKIGYRTNNMWVEFPKGYKLEGDGKDGYKVLIKDGWLRIDVKNECAGNATLKLSDNVTIHLMLKK